MSDSRRIEELSELLFDGELTADEAKELRAHLESTPAAVVALRAASRDHLLCRTALRPADRLVLAERTRLMLDSWRPSSREVAVQAVFSRVDRRRRWAAVRTWGGLAAAALVLVLLAPAVTALLLHPAVAPDARAPQLTDVTGEIRLDNGLVLAAGERLAMGATVISGTDARATLVWSDGTRITLAANTTISRLPGAGQHLSLTRGTVSVDAAHRGADDPLEIICPDATARVVGTAFSATVIDGRSQLTVSNGLVRWQRAVDGAWSLLGAGQQATAAALPLPRAILMDSGQLAALRDAIAAGREPWLGSWKTLTERVPTWLAAPIDAPAELEVTGYFPGNAQHTGARQLLYRLTQPALGLALAARMTGDQACARAALARIRAATAMHLHGTDADTVGCDTLTVFTLQAADLLRVMPGWNPADDQLINAWIAREAAPQATRMQQPRSMGARWRGLAAGMTIAAWRGDQANVRALMAELRADIPAMLTHDEVAKLVVASDDNHTLHQALNHALLCADIARVAAGDATPPSPAWTEAVRGYLTRTGPDRGQESQYTYLLRALSGSEPWRNPAARQGYHGAESLLFSYGWYFPTLTAQDPRWP